MFHVRDRLTPHRAVALLAIVSVVVGPAPLEASPTPGHWRRDANVVAAIRARAAARHETLAGWNVEHVVNAAFLDNHAVSDEQLVAMSRVTLSQLSDSADGLAETERRVPNVRALDCHRFTVAVMSVLTGVEFEALSKATPSLGLTGAPGTGLLFASDVGRLQRSTALHDTTDYLRGAGVVGVNGALWGIEGREVSALISFVAGAPL